MDVLWIVFAFACGLGLKLLGLPPLIGFLVAGFALNYAGVEGNETLDTLANLGITLMLFTIGLKLQVKDLLKREVWAGALVHLGAWSIAVTALVLVLTMVGLSYFAGLDARAAALVAFALSFSSTVCVIKVLEESGELSSRHGKLSVGILVMQDVVAVVFLVAATGEVPSPWAVLLMGLYFARPLLGRVLEWAGHGEMLPLTGFMLALGGYELFYLVGVKGDLGALVLGTLISAHPKANELAKSLLSFKDLFLIGFFLSIGLRALPDLGMFSLALALCLLLPLKGALFFALLTRLRLRARTAFLASLALGNYSEFGLIVMVLCVAAGWLSDEWLVILALAVSLSFVVTSLGYRSAHLLYSRGKTWLRRYESAGRLSEDEVYRPSSAEILVVGTGRVGRGAFQALHKVVGDRVWGMDADRDLIARQRADGMHVFAADAENADVWDAIDVASINLVLLSVPSITDCRNITEQLRIAGYQGPIAAIARYEDEIVALQAAGIDKVFNFFTEAGSAFAEDSLRLVAEQRSGPR
ncbi:MAG: glutathione-regulated potassium-efflux system ancillary protein KefC [Gammaproteobacteria bacterium]|jgi:glutathione-regulated potassium-efflux system ancillary protein KefC